MADRPHDVTDLYLAPVLLAVDARIEELGKLDKDALAYEVVLASNSLDTTRQMREEALIRTITHLIETAPLGTQLGSPRSSPESRRAHVRPWHTGGTPRLPGRRSAGGQPMTLGPELGTSCPCPEVP